MLGDASPIAFIAITNAAAAINFYCDTLGLQLVADEPFAVVLEMNGTMLRLQKVKQVNPAAHTVLGWMVADLDEMQAKFAETGVPFEHFPSIGQNKNGVVMFPDGARVAWFRDPDGNLLSLTETPEGD